MTELQWSASALHARSVFFEDFNDIDIYVEDTDATTIRIFTTLFQRALSHLRIETVFGLGGRYEVTKRFESDSANARKRLYVIDGDFSYILGDLPHHDTPKGIFRLSRYCIENYLIDKDAFSQVAHDEDGHRRPSELMADARFDEWIVEVSPQLLKLSLSYACSEFFELGAKTCSRSIENFYENGEGALNEAKIAQAIDELRNTCDSRNYPGAFDEKLDELAARSRLISAAHFAIPSGKNYCLPLLIRKLKWLTRSRASDKSLSMRLSRYANLEEISLASGFIIN